MARQEKRLLKIHVGVDIDTRHVLAVKIIDEHSNDSKHLKGIVRESARHGNLIKVLGDGAFDSRQIFSYRDDKNITPAIKVKLNSIPKSRGCHSRKVAVTEQLADYHKWCASVSYGQRWVVESVFSAIKKMFGEEVRSKKKRNMIQEMMLKVSLYNEFMVA